MVAFRVQEWKDFVSILSRRFRDVDPELPILPPKDLIVRPIHFPPTATVPTALSLFSLYPLASLASLFARPGRIAPDLPGRSIQ